MASRTHLPCIEPAASSRTNNTMPEKPQLNDKEISGLQRILSLLDPQNALTKADFTKAFKALTEYVKNIDQRNAQQFTQIATTLTQFAQKLKDDTTNDTTNFKNEASTTIQAQLADLQSRIAAHDARIATLTDGDDGISPDANEVARLAAELIKLPEYRAPIMDGPDELATKLDLLDDENQLAAIKAIRKDISELKARPSGGGGLSQIALKFALSKIIKHEKFTTSSATTTVSLANKVAGSVCLWLRYNGTMLRYGTDYTLSGKTVTFVGFTLDDSSSVEVTYFTD